MNLTDDKVSLKRSVIAEIIIFIILVLGDQLTKLAARTYLRGRGGADVIPGVFRFEYLENRGAAFGILNNRQWIFILFAAVIILAIIFIYTRLTRMRDKRYRFLRLICVCLAAGALGNMLDRILHTYVIDFLYFSLIDFPVFNVADVYVCVSCAVLLCLLIFYYSEDDLNRIFRKEGD
ncbi:MAG: signal peptidase II [Lachnospiraceae bacterium]|nr:signal peptidase II [Lachnospiraceae bacterium]